MTTVPKGYFKYLLAIDVETTGLCFNSDFPTYNPATGERYQAVSLGLIVVDADTLQPIEDLYVEIKWDGVSIWNMSAEKIHGLSITHLEENGLSPEDAVVSILEVILKYWGTDGVICLMGHNVASFDKFFLQQLMRDHDIELKLGNRTLDSNSVGYSCFGTYTSDEVFSIVGVNRGLHNALDDAYASLKVFQVARALCDSAGQ